jgi:two-component system NtrC family response regulator
MARILIIDDDELIRNSLARCFSNLGHEVALAEGLAAGARLAQTGVDIVYLDLGLPDGDGRTAITGLAAAPGHPEVIVLTGLKDNFGAQETLTSGAWDYIQKPATPTALRSSLESALQYRADRNETVEPPQSFEAAAILGNSPAMEQVKQSMARAAQSEASVLILGETGVGKELTAKAIHDNGSRQGRPFVVVDCSNLTENLLESLLYGHVRGAFTGALADHRGLVAEADGGTLFLDEIGELPPALQKSFLRVLQEHRFRPVGASRELNSDFRLIAATNRDLAAMAEAGTFRQDLLFRVRTLEIQLPPLRQRAGDIPVLAAHFATQACARYHLPAKRFSKQLSQILASHTWPGNVRELANVMEAAVIAAGQEPAIYPKHLPAQVRVSCLDQGRTAASEPAPLAAEPGPETPLPTYKDYKARQDRTYFRQLMDACASDIARASQLSGLSVPSIYRYLGQAGIPTKNRR